MSYTLKVKIDDTVINKLSEIGRCGIVFRIHSLDGCQQKLLQFSIGMHISSKKPFKIDDTFSRYVFRSGERISDRDVSYWFSMQERNINPFIHGKPIAQKSIELFDDKIVITFVKENDDNYIKFVFSDDIALEDIIDLSESVVPYGSYFNSNFAIVSPAVIILYWAERQFGRSNVELRLKHACYNEGEEKVFMLPDDPRMIKQL